jgi:uncharacterized membrane protein YedE/YeeE
MSKDIILAMPIGLVFGAAVHLSGVSSPQALRAQFIFEKQIMMKMFLGGIAGSALSLAIISYYNTHAFDKARETRGFGDKGIMSAVVGGIIQGSGMAIAASCPGMVFAQLGAGVPSAPLVYLGGIAGASLYSYLHPWLKDHHMFDFARTLEGRVDSMHLERLFFSGKFIPIAVSFAAITLSAAIGIEQVVPWRADVADVYGVPQDLALNPVAAGLILGSLQIPTFLLLNTFLGASSGYSATSSQILRLVPDEFLVQYTYAKKFINSKASWQVGLGLGISLGASIFSGFGRSVLEAVKNATAVSNPSMPHVPNLQAFVGGVLIVFGARFAGGCASGHGISGLPSLHVISWFTVPSLFAGAILTGHLMSLGMGKAEYLLQV